MNMQRPMRRCANSREGFLETIIRVLCLACQSFLKCINLSKEFAIDSVTAVYLTPDVT